MQDDELMSRVRQSKVSEVVGLLAPGTRMGDWRLTAYLAHGGMADVYCAEHVAIGTAAAVKILRDEGKETRRERFRREAKLLSELKSLSFPRFYAYGTANGRDYLVEELLEPREFPKGNRESTRLLLSICAAVGELHARGLVHCDIKPANILFRSESGTPVLVDLGLAVAHAETPSGGTPGYSAPEQFLGGEVTRSSDIHALGVLAEHLGMTCRTIICRATSSIPSERFKSVEEFTNAIRRRQWGVCLRWTAVALSVLTAVAAAVLVAISSEVPEEIRLKGAQMVLNAPLRIPAGRTVRVVGPGTLDGVIVGEKGACLWMTNCIVINRSEEIFPTVSLRYELTRGVYLNFINAADAWRDMDKHVYVSDGHYNEVRFRGPATARELQIRRSMEFQDDL